jgi:hypothetical protein
LNSAHQNRQQALLYSIMTYIYTVFLFLFIKYYLVPCSDVLSSFMYPGNGGGGGGAGGGAGTGSISNIRDVLESSILNLSNFFKGSQKYTEL